MNAMDESFESERLADFISGKKAFLEKVEKSFARKKLQEEILFLENDILPIVAKNTTLLYSEIHKYLDKYIRKAIEMGNDAILMFIPFRDITDKCDIGVVNPKAQRFGKENIDSVEIFISDMGVGGRKIEIKHLEVD